MFQYRWTIILVFAPLLCAASEPSAFSFRSYNFPGHYIGLNILRDPSIVTKQELYRIVSPGLQGQPGTVSFESVREPGNYLRHQNFLLQLQPYSNAALYKEDATFWPRKSRFFPEFTAYESINYPKHFIRHQGYRLKLATETVYSDLFKKDASFIPVAGSSVAALRSYNFPTHYFGLDGNGLPSIVEDYGFYQVLSPGLTGAPGSVSFESKRSPGMFLRHQGFLLKLHTFNNPNDDLFRKDATFMPRQSKYFPEFTAYESVNYPNYFIRHQNYRLKITTGSSDLFKKDASFFSIPDVCHHS